MATVKPTSPLRSKTAPKTPISQPQRRWRFQSHTGTSEQRRRWFQTTGLPHLQHPNAAPVGGCGAWPGFEATRRATRQHTRPHRCGGRRRDRGHGRVSRRGAWPRCRWAVAGPGRASRSTTPSRRLACGDLAGGPPPTGTHSGPDHQGKPRGARNTRGATSNKQRTQKRPPGTGWAYLSRLWESNPRPIHYE